MADDILAFSRLFAGHIRSCFNIHNANYAQDASPRSHFGPLHKLIEHVLHNKFPSDNLNHAYTALYLLHRLWRNSSLYTKQHPADPDPRSSPWPVGNWELLSNPDGGHLLAAILLCLTEFDLEKDDVERFVADCVYSWAHTMFEGASVSDDDPGQEGAFGALREAFSEGCGGVLVRLGRQKQPTHIDPAEMQQFREMHPLPLLPAPPSDPTPLHVSHEDQVEQASNTAIQPHMESHSGLVALARNLRRTAHSLYSHSTNAGSSQARPPRIVIGEENDPPPSHSAA